MVLRASLARTRTYAWMTALGVATGVMMWDVAAAVGISALLAASETAYRLLTTAGAAYMLWRGASMIWKSFRRRPLEAVTSPVDHALAPSLWRGWVLGLGSNVLNPKAGTLYIAMIPQLLPAETSPLLLGVVLPGVHCALFLGWCGVLILGSGYARRWLSSPRSLTIVD